MKLLRIDFAGLSRRFGRDERGLASIFAAGFSLCLVASLALAVDVGSFSLARRSDQSALDLAAMSAARNLANAEAVARDILAKNGHANPKSLKVTLGRYDADPKISPDKRFRPNITPLNAVQLDMSTSPPVYFAQMLLKDRVPQVATSSVAAATKVASFSIGSRLASLNGGLVNSMLSQMLGASVSLNVMDYNSLASAQVDMPDLLARLAPKVGVVAGTYDDVLSTTPTVTQIVQTLSETPGLSYGLKNSLAQIAAVGSVQKVNLRQMLSLGPFAKLAVGASTRITATASALDIMTTALGIATGGRQVNLDLGTQVPGVLGLTLAVTVGERPQTSPWLAIGAENVTVSTAQTRVRLTSKVGGVLGLPSLSLPLAVDVAAGRARLAAAKCGPNPATDGQATLSVTPTVVELWVGEPKNLQDWNNFALPPDVKPATIIDVLLLSATASAHVAAENLQPRNVVFSASEIANGTVKTVDTQDIAQSTLQSLTDDMTIVVNLKLLGASLGTPQSVAKALSGALTPVGATLDPVINQVLGLVGVGLGEADVSVKGLRCDGSALVN